MEKGNLQSNFTINNEHHDLNDSSILGTGWGMWALRSIDRFGLDPIIGNLRGTPSPPMTFTIRGPYRWVRHPLYLLRKRLCLNRL